MTASAVLVLRFGRGTTFSVDELAVFMQSPGLDLSGALHPHDGHLVLVVRLVDKAILEIFGSSYLTFRLLSVATVLLTVGLLFTYLKRRVPPYVALAPCLVLLVFGSDALHVISGNAFGVMFAVSCGVAALLTLEREDLKGDIAACALLCLGVLTYSVALAFVAGAGISILLSRDRWHRLWVVAIPIVLYGAWSIWAIHLNGPENQTQLSNVLLLPSWGAQSLSALLGALTGFDYPFASGSSAARIGPPLALLALLGVGLRLRLGRNPVSLWTALAVILTMWTIGVLTFGGNRVPDSPRYLFPGAVAMLLVLGGCAAALRWTRPMVIALYLVAASGVAVNVFILHDEGARLRSEAVEARASFAGLDIAGENMKADFDPTLPPKLAGPLPGGSLTFAFGAVSEVGLKPPVAYRAASDSYGPLGYSVAEVRSAADPIRARTDSSLVNALGLKAHVTARIPSDSTCRTARSTTVDDVEIKLPAGGAILESGMDGPLKIRRFAGSHWWSRIGGLSAGQPAVLRVPRDHLPDSWWIAVPTTTLRVCDLQ